MKPQGDSDIAARIRREVHDAALPMCLRYWLRAHLIDPRPIVLCTNLATGEYGRFLLITDHVGEDDAPFRIVYDASGFGLEVTLDGVAHLVHRVPSLQHALEAL